MLENSKAQKQCCGAAYFQHVSISAINLWKLTKGMSARVNYNKKMVSLLDNPSNTYNQSNNRSLCAASESIRLKFVDSKRHSIEDFFNWSAPSISWREKSTSTRRSTRPELELHGSQGQWSGDSTNSTSSAFVLSRLWPSNFCFPLIIP